MKRSHDRINYYSEKSGFKEINRTLKNNSNKRMHIRYMAKLNYHQGYKINEIVYMNNISPQTVGVYVKKYKSLGLSDLSMSKSLGIPRHLTNDQELELITIRTPDEEGFIAREKWNIQ